MELEYSSFAERSFWVDAVSSWQARRVLNLMTDAEGNTAVDEWEWSMEGGFPTCRAGLDLVGGRCHLQYVGCFRGAVGWLLRQGLLHSCGSTTRTHLVLFTLGWRRHLSRATSRGTMVP